MERSLFSSKYSTADYVLRSIDHVDVLDDAIKYTYSAFLINVLTSSGSTASPQNTLQLISYLESGLVFKLNPKSSKSECQQRV